MTPRGLAAMGLVYASLAGAKSRSALQVREDAREAQVWLEKSLAAWRAVQSDGAFAPPHRREMLQVETALAALKGR
ncbi:MAG: hypothetical protein ABIZ80_23510 [Bryobacteraceae bacterium]